MKTFLALALIATVAVDARNIQQPKAVPRRVVDNDESRVTEGSEASFGQFPYQAYFEDGPYICGASIIAQDVALTAAHCCANVNPNIMFIDVGGLDRYNIQGEFQRVGVANKISHEDYNSRTVENDVCLLQLEENIDFNDAAKPADAIRLAPSNKDADHYFGQIATVTGWGTTSPNGALARIMQYAEVTVVSDDFCRAEGYADDAITPDMICAQDLDTEAHVDACQGDSGGPMALGGADVDYKDREQVGIVSWGYSCGVNGFPGVYSDVAYLRDWIDANNPTRG